MILPSLTPAPSDRESIADFHRRYYESGAWRDTVWRGYRLLTCPNDAWTLQEIVAETRPHFVVCWGTRVGLAAYLADVQDAVGAGRTLWYGEPLPRYPSHRRLQVKVGDRDAWRDHLGSVGGLGEGAKLIVVGGPRPETAVRADLEWLARFAISGDVLVAEHSHVNGYPVELGYGPGPAEAVEGFLTDHPEWAFDPSRQRHGLSFSPGAWLLRS